MTRTIFRSFCAIALCASIVAITVPLSGQVPPPPRQDCCAVMKMNHHQQTAPDQDGCPVKPSSQEQKQPQCCAGCAAFLTLFLATNLAALPPNVPSETLLDRAARTSLRAEQPPVPPPRLAPV